MSTMRHKATCGKLRGYLVINSSPPLSISSPHEWGRTKVGSFILGEGIKGRVMRPTFPRFTLT